MKPRNDFERTEEQEKLAKLADANLAVCIGFNFVCFISVCVLGLNTGTLLLLGAIPIVDVFWFHMISVFKEEANTPGPGCKVNFTPPEMREKDKNA